jgi:phosphoribosylaminoimidazolecarboxamide formyltransferase/IMP cyclohydrolase
MTRRALISVWDKTGVVDFARGLVAMGWELVSTGGTQSLLGSSGLPVVPVSDVGGFPEILDGRVKTLLPQIHGGILARRDNPGHMRQLQEHGITPIDLVAVNLYPFRQVTRDPDVALDRAVENIDIGGPTMIRAAAKNYPHVLVIVNPARYEGVLAALRAGEVTPRLRFELAVEAFAHTAEYDALVAEYLGRAAGRGVADFPGVLCLRYEKVQGLRYGENPHQRAAFYADSYPGAGPSLAHARILAGKELSYNNINDAAAALATVREFPAPAAVAVKHANPCGAACATDLLTAYTRAHDADPVSIFGGIVAANRVVDEATARKMAETFLEVVVAPDFSHEALQVLGQRKGLRLAAVGDLAAGAGAVEYEVRRVPGGLLVQDVDVAPDDPAPWRVVTRSRPSAATSRDLDFAWRVVRHVKSNAIVIAAGGATLSIGAGQMSRIDAARIALERAGAAARGAVMASDGFFPFPDVVAAASDAGIVAVVQPGGSVKDDDVVRAADERGLAMLFTGRRHFLH